MSELQRRFTKSKLLKGRLYLYLLQTGYATGHDKRTFYRIFANVYGRMPEAQIKWYLLQCLQCYDLTEDERTEALQLLALASTALTAAQRAYILEDLNE